MAQQSSGQIQQQTMEQRQTLSQQQLLFVRLLELPTEELEERVRAEVLENPALEEKEENDFGEEGHAAGQETYEAGEEENGEQEEPDEEVSVYEPETPVTDDTLADYGSEDDIPDYELREHNTAQGTLPEEIPFSAATSFYEQLQEQLGECPFSPHEREVAEYIVGSFDDDGLLRKELVALADELAIYHGITTDPEEIGQILHVIQKLDPPGIGAQSLQECLTLQLQRKPDSPSKQTALLILRRCYDDFTYKRWDHIMQRLHLTEEEFQQALAELTRLNPKPGSALGESIDKGMQQIIPDFIVKVDEEGTVTFSLNDGNLPELRISNSFNRLMKEYAEKKEPGREEREALIFLKQKMDSAQGFIDVITQRQRTLTITMQAIIDLQRPFFLEGDEELLKPMKLKDVADRAGVDISTVSRVSNCKYAATDFGIYPLKFFFSDSFRKPGIALAKEKKKDPEKKEKASHKEHKEQEEKSLRQVRTIIQECVANEERQNPLTDEQLVDILKERGYEMARRTVAKYRQQLGIPVARMRR